MKITDRNPSLLLTVFACFQLSTSEGLFLSDVIPDLPQLSAVSTRHKTLYYGLEVFWTSLHPSVLLEPYFYKNYESEMCGL